MNPTSGRSPDSFVPERRDIELSKAVSPGIIEKCSFVLNRVLGFMVHKMRHVCQD